MNITPGKSSNDGTGNQLQPDEDHVRSNSSSALPLAICLSDDSNKTKGTQSEGHAPYDADNGQVLAAWLIVLVPWWD